MIHILFVVVFVADGFMRCLLPQQRSGQLWIADREENPEAESPKKRNLKALLLKKPRKVNSLENNEGGSNPSTETEAAAPPVDDDDDLLNLIEEGGLITSARSKYNKDSVRNPSSAAASTVESIQAMIDERSAARIRRDYDTADAIRTELETVHGVKLFENDGVWTLPSQGLRGPLNYEKVATSVRKLSFKDNDQSQTPCTLTVGKIQKMVEERTIARRSYNFDIADQIRDELVRNGVELYDKSNEWRTFDGSMSGLQSQDRRQGNQEREWIAKVSQPTDPTVSSIQQLVDQRSLAQRNRDFETADAIKEELANDYGVMLADKRAEWSTTSGLRGKINPPPRYSPPTDPTVMAIQQLIDERSEAKKNRDYDTADALTEELKSKYNVRTFDRDGEWSTPSGLRGQIVGQVDGEVTTRYSSPTDPTVSAIQALVDQRIEAKRNRDFETADAIQEELKISFGVSLWDKDGEWTTPSGLRGQIRRVQQRGDESFGRRRDGNREQSFAGQSFADPAVVAIQELVDQRSEAKRNRDFDTADAIRDELASKFDVRLWDKDGEWSTPSGLRGRIITRGRDGGRGGNGASDEPYSSPTDPTVSAIQALVDQRGEAKRNRDYDTADAIRDELASKYEVRLFDRDGEWFTPSGLRGRISGSQSDFGRGGRGNGGDRGGWGGGRGGRNQFGGNRDFGDFPPRNRH